MHLLCARYCFNAQINTFNPPKQLCEADTVIVIPIS